MTQVGSPKSETGYALKGIRVVDFTWVHAGPSATRVLADQGAEVIKIESNMALAVVGGPASRTARGVGSRHNWNAGKLSIALNMKTPQGIDIARRLAGVSDVVTENFSGRVMHSWGMDYHSLRDIRPDIIMLSMSGLGRSGPWKDYVSYGQTLQAWCGLTYLTGFPDTDPCGPASAYSDATAGMAGAQAVLLALMHRARTGQGQWIDLSQFEALSSIMGPLFLDLSVNGRDGNIRRTGNRLPHGGGAPHGAYRCKGEDRWVAITVFTDDQWNGLRRAMGDPIWAREKRFATAGGREHHADDLDRLVETWTIGHSPEEVMERLQTEGVPAGVVHSGAGLASDPQLKERGFFKSVPDARGAHRVIEAAPYKLSRTPGGVHRGAPEFREIWDSGAVDILQPDITQTGGLLEAKKIASTAEIYSIMVAPHNVGGIVSTMAALHLCLTLRNAKILEHFNDFADPHVKKAGQGYPEVVDGYFPVPTEAGWGIELDEDFIRSQPPNYINGVIADPGLNMFENADWAQRGQGE